MKTSLVSARSIEWISLVAAIVIGPAFLLVGYQTPGLIFGAAAVILLCVIVVPLLTLAAGRFKYLAWQLAIISIVLAVIGDNLRLHAIFHSEILPVAYFFWAGGTLLSSPLPLYFLLKPLAQRQRSIAAIIMAAVALALLLGIKKISG